MNLLEKTYQLFILGYDGGNLSKALSKGLGGVIFFKNDILSEKDVMLQIDEIKKISKVSPFISIDQEGGRVERTQNILGERHYLSQKFAFKKNIVESQTQDIADKLKKYGFNLNFSPCIDVNTNPNNPIIGERAFSNNPNDVIKGGLIVSQTLRNNKIIPCAKHFPGHGDAQADSHLELPTIALSMEEMESTHIAPFKALIENKIEMIMIAHLYCTCFEDKILPSSLSKKVIDYLKNNLEFNGVIVSDDMEMKALKDFENCYEKALKAGINLFICRNSNDETIKQIENLHLKALQDKSLEKIINESYEKIITLKQKYNLL